jgi:integrase
MGSVRKTKAGTFEARWRDAANRQCCKTFATKREASAFVAEVEASLSRGAYVDPHAGRIRFGDYAERWLAARHNEATTMARDGSIMRNHVIDRWGSTPLGKIDHLAVQAWVTELGTRLAPATVAECHRLLSSTLRAAVRDRYISANPCDGIRLPARRKKDTDGQTITREELTGQLLPAVPDRYRALVGLAGGTGLRWGECVGVRWDCVDLDAKTVSVRVAVEVAGTVTTKGYPKSRAGRRTVPIPDLETELLKIHRELVKPGPVGEVFTNTALGPERRTLFRARVWRPSLVRAGLLGQVTRRGHFEYRATWTDATGLEWSKDFPTEREAVAHVARTAHGGLRFHDLRHSYATWLISNGVPINDVVSAMGHEKATTTLNIYTHRSSGRDDRIRAAFVEFSLSLISEDGSGDDEDPYEEGP